MSLEVREISNKEIWEDFLLGCEEKTFLSSWDWGEFQKMMRNKIWRLGVFENSKLVNLTLTIKIKAKRGTFLFIPHLFSDKYLQVLINYLKERAREEKADFIRISPLLKRNEENIEIFKKLGFREAPIHMHPELSWELDLTLNENDLLKQMRKTTRYLIRQAEKNKDIKIEKNNSLEGVEKFNLLYKETVNRQHFVPFSLHYLKNEFLAFGPNNEISIFLGKYKNELVSSAIIVFWQNTAFYHQSASSLKYPKIPVSYLLLWEAIREAKRRGCKKFNFWGIAPFSASAENGNQKSKIKNQKFEIRKHPWAGLTLFKMGFGGYKKEYVKTQDLPLSPKYWLNYIVEKIRKTKRGL
ncbi:peptidoglycan bridge formation glycyltransferase FemA/FemB family protein [Patescibacteria group bacterium]|nr:peptidoglycan bridge formation glycyltransferase FemA/FemB family protein [Patescibacteria group bacterium]MBU4481724.1 peptidoglycan bridge formation glycyltransferase FemA/FemB family protein [Patescibacteria group bacterium]